MSNDKQMREESIQNIGVIDLGRTGTAIANNILKSGFNLVVHNGTSDKSRVLVQSGAISAASPKEAAAKSDVLLTSLRYSAIIKSLCRYDDPIRISLGEHL
jgi:3-hydroxyisobutyrate dehydrogenase-like beta-hydroxyacid dehydrogenase